MTSRELILENLRKSRDRTLVRIEDMVDHCMVPSTSPGGPHTLWILGHLAYIEGLVIHSFMLGEPNPLAEWVDPFDGAEVSGRPGDYPPFEEVLARCGAVREGTIRRLEGLRETDLETVGRNVPEGWEDTFGTYRRCFQYVADHWYMHRGQLADARRRAGVDRMWV